MNIFPLSIRLPLKLTASAVFMLLAGSLQAQSHAAKTADCLTLDHRVTVFLAEHQPPGVEHAAEDLVTDLTKVFGKGPRLVRSAREAGSVSIVVGPTRANQPGEMPTGAEAFAISCSAASGGVGAVRLSGADMRGTIYSIYQFSEEFLGVDPMYYWTDNEPARRETVRIPASLDKKYPSPVFRYRGFFINDEDLLTGWAPGEKEDHTGISLAVWNKIYETVLRLKGNMIVAGTFPFPGEPQQLLTAQRGLILHQHHATPLGVNVARWPKDTPYNYTTHPELLERAWARAVAAIPAQQEVLWTVGLRGLSDQTYSALDPSVQGNPEALGRVIGEAIAEEMRIVRKVQPNAVFVTNLWSEGAQLLRDGYLKLPSGVITTWPDTGYLDMQDKGQAGPGQGAYIHVAMMNRNANQLTELVPTERIFDQLQRFQDADATSFLLINTSDIRPVSMNARAAMELGWRGREAGTSDQYLRAWAVQEFGAAAADHVVELYHQYFKAPAERHDMAQPVGDQYYHTEVRNLALETEMEWPLWLMPTQSPLWREPYPLFMKAQPDPLQVAEDRMKRCAAAQPRWDALWEQAERAEREVRPDRRNFFESQILTMIAINRESNRMLLEFARSVLAYKRGDLVTAAARVQDAIDATERIRKQESQAEYGKWKDWYAGDWHTSVRQTQAALNGFRDHIRDPDGPLPPPMSWSLWEAYYHIMHYQGMREVDLR